MLQNPFLVIRYACFSLILFLNVLTLIFAAVHVAVMKSSGQAAPGASVLLLFNACAIFVFITSALVELVVLKPKLAKVKFECAWTALMGVLQLAAALTTTTTGPPLMCRANGDLMACTATTVLVPVSWLSCFSTIAYFLTLTITAVVYAPACPGIWKMSMYEVSWYVEEDTPPLSHKFSADSAVSASSDGSATLCNPKVESKRTRGIWDEEEKDERELQRSTSDSRTCGQWIAPWAVTSLKNKRGRDPPFATRSLVLAGRPESTAESTFVPPIASKYMGVSRPYPSETIECERERHTLSQWVRADIEQGRNVHSIPPITPR